MLLHGLLELKRALGHLIKGLNVKKLILFCFLFFITTTTINAQEFSRVKIFVSGEDGYHTYRVPVLITTPNGNTIAFCEGRVNDIGDSGNIDIMMRRSSDSGVTWSDMEVIIGEDDDDNAFGVPTAVIDKSNGRLWLFMRWTDLEHDMLYGLRMYVTYSDDDGVTWADTTDITTDVTLPNPDPWDWFVSGPGLGIQCDSGRLLIPGDCRYVSGDSLYSYTFFSDDHGTTWEMGGLAGASGEELEECQLVELLDGTIMLNARTKAGNGLRALVISEDEGETWGEVDFHEQLIVNVSMGSFIRYDATRLLFTCPIHPTARRHLKLRVSYNEGKTWDLERWLHYGWAGYSCLTVFPNATIGCLYENGSASFREQISLATFSIGWVEFIAPSASRVSGLTSTIPPLRGGRK